MIQTHAHTEELTDDGEKLALTALLVAIGRH